MARTVAPSDPLRTHPRLALKLPMACRVPKLQGRTQSEDISVGGIAMIVPRSIAIGDRLEFDLALPDGTACRLVGEVCRAQEVGEKSRRRVGLRWTDLDARKIGLVSRYFERLRELTALPS